MKLIPLTQGKFAKVDDADFETLNQHKWCASLAKRTWYACRGIVGANGKQTTISMHREILKLRWARLADHRDGDGLNNQRHNLRRCTPKQNARNSRKAVGASSRFRGVSWHQVAQKWVVQIRIGAKSNKYLGLFLLETEAAAVYDAAAARYHGKFARLNFPENKNLTTANTPVDCPTT